jgi:MFS family permease
VGLLNSYSRVYRGLSPEGRRFLWLAATVEYTYLGVYLIAFNLYLLRLDFGPEFIGVATGAGIAAYSVTAFVCGYLFRRRSLYGLVLGGSLIIVVGLTGVAYTDLVPPGGQATWLLVLNVLAWTGGALFDVGRLPYMVSVVPPELRVLAFSLERLMGIGLSFLGGLAVTVVPGLAARLLDTDLDDPAPYRLAILLGPLGLILPFALFVHASRRAPPPGEAPDEQPVVHRDSSRFSPRAMILLLSAFTVLFNFASTPPLYFFNVYLDEGLNVSPALIAFVMGLARLGSLPATFLLPVLTRRWSLGALLVAIAVALAVALVPMALVGHALVASLCFLTCSLLLAVFEPVFDLYRMDVVPRSLRTHMSGTTQTATYGAQSAAGFVGGYAVVSMGYPSLFLGATALALAAATLLLPLRRKRQLAPPQQGSLRTLPVRDAT